MKNTLIFLKAKYLWHEALETRTLKVEVEGVGADAPLSQKLAKRFDCNQSVHQQELIRCHWAKVFQEKAWLKGFWL